MPRWDIEGAWWKECLPEGGQTRTRVRPPGPGDAGVNGAEVSAPPGSEKPTGLFSLIRAAWGRVT
ncbi:MAG: hypothetical protein IJB89_10010 [Akkermansia sp.]|nr:hypothetical protein [Akkermansia sp.]